LGAAQGSLRHWPVFHHLPPLAAPFPPPPPPFQGGEDYRGAVAAAGAVAPLLTLVGRGDVGKTVKHQAARVYAARAILALMEAEDPLGAEVKAAAAAKGAAETALRGLAAFRPPPPGGKQNNNLCCACYPPLTGY